MSEENKHFIKRYEELLDEGYCDCNEMNCIDNNTPRRILNIVKELQDQLQQKENIIKEVREIFKDYGDKEDIVGYANYNIIGEMLIRLLEILDKKVD